MAPNSTPGALYLCVCVCKLWTLVCVCKLSGIGLSTRKPLLELTLCRRTAAHTGSSPHSVKENSTLLFGVFSLTQSRTAAHRANNNVQT